MDSDNVYIKTQLVNGLRKCHSCGMLDYHKYWMILLSL